MAQVAHIKVECLAWQPYEAWCLRCLLTTMHVRLYMRLGRDVVTVRRCTECDEEPEREQ